MDSILLYGTFGLLMFGPLAFGAVEPWAIFIIELGSILLTLLWLAKQWLDGEINIVWNALFPPMAAFGGLVFVQLVFRTSAYSHDTIAQLMLYCAYAMLGFLATQSLVRASQARKIAVILGTFWNRGRRVRACCKGSLQTESCIGSGCRVWADGCMALT